MSRGMSQLRKVELYANLERLSEVTSNESEDCRADTSCDRATLLNISLHSFRMLAAPPTETLLLWQPDVGMSIHITAE